MKKKVITLLLSLTIVLSLMAGTFSASATYYSNSGSKSIEKLSKGEIAMLLDETGDTFEGNYYSKIPSITSPYDPGTIDPDLSQYFLDRLNVWRKICGLPEISLDKDLTNNAQYGAVLEAAAKVYGHNVDKPADMDATFYEMASKSLHSSNLYHNVPLNKAIDGFMRDMGEINNDTIGHRRWQLNPAMGKTGFGICVTGTDTYLTEWAFDTSSSCSDYDYISFPSSGYFPNNTYAFDNEVAWTITVNPSRYQTPKADSVKVTLTRESDGKSWSFANAPIAPESESDAFFYIDTKNAGVSNCIIFKPDISENYDGVYTVHVDGLKHPDGSNATIDFQVDFFDAKAYRYPFKDVNSSDWFIDYAAEMFDRGIMGGTAPEIFDPDVKVTRAMVMTMLWRIEGSPACNNDMIFSDVQPGTYYYDAIRWANEKGIGNGVGDNKFEPEREVLREEMAVFLYRYASYKGYDLNVANSNILSKFKDNKLVASYATTAMAWACERGMFSGRDDGSLDPSGGTIRAEVAKILTEFLHTYA